MMFREDDEMVHIIDSIESGDFEMVIEHTEEMIALLEANGLTAECWVYGSWCRPLSGTWFRVEGVTLIQNDQRHRGEAYTYAVSATRLSREDINANELDLVSRPARNK
jgi:hypothetical protein